MERSVDHVLSIVLVLKGSLFSFLHWPMPNSGYCAKNLQEYIPIIDSEMIAHTVELLSKKI